MKKQRFYLLGVLLMLCTVFVQAQEMRVTTLQRMDRDLLARTKERRDLNDVPSSGYLLRMPRSIRLMEMWLVKWFTDREKPLSIWRKAPVTLPSKVMSSVICSMSLPRNWKDRWCLFLFVYGLLLLLLRTQGASSSFVGEGLWCDM